MNDSTAPPVIQVPVGMILGGNFDAERTARLRRQHVNDEGVLRVHGVIARAEERLRREFEHIVAAVAEHDLFRAYT